MDEQRRYFSKDKGQNYSNVTITQKWLDKTIEKWIAQEQVGQNQSAKNSKFNIVPGNLKKQSIVLLQEQCQEPVDVESTLYQEVHSQPKWKSYVEYESRELVVAVE